MRCFKVIVTANPTHVKSSPSDMRCFFDTGEINEISFFLCVWETRSVFLSQIVSLSHFSELYIEADTQQSSTSFTL